MPTYEYECDACKNRFEKFQSIKAEPIKKCPQCGKSKVRRLIGTGAGLIFKGSGFYITDYRSESYKDASKAESGAKTEGKSEGKADAKADAKPAETKSETKAEVKPKAEAKPAAKAPAKPAAKADK